MARLGHVPALDGMRGVAVLLVVGFHAINIPRSGGLLGVGFFFVLSGFLITTLLLEEHSTRKTISLRQFYLRRALRLFPLLFLALGVIAAFVPFIVSAAERDHYRTSLLWSALYSGNFYGITTRSAELAPATGHFWSLAVEEQFYLVWPMLLLLVLQRAKRATLLRLIVLGIIGCVVLRMVLLAAGLTIWTLPTTHGDALLLGCALAVLRQEGLLEPWIERHQRPLVALVALGALVALVSPLLAAGRALGAVYLFTELLGAGLVLLSLRESAVRTVLTGRLLVYCGRISYGLYVIHPILVVAIDRNLHGLPGWLRTALAVVAAFGLAAASRRWFEAQFPRGRAKVEGRPILGNSALLTPHTSSSVALARYPHLGGGGVG